MFRLEKDVDFAWVEADFGSGLEKYKITHYTLVLNIIIYSQGVAFLV